MDWRASGIRNTYSYELVDSRTLESLGRALGGVTGGRLSESYRGDLRQSATLEVDGGEVPPGCSVRIAHTAEADGGQLTRVLATLVPQAAAVEFVHGTAGGSLPLQSSMCKLASMVTLADRARPAGMLAHRAFADLCAEAGCVAAIHPGIEQAARRTGAARVWMGGDDALGEAHALADTCGGYVSVDAMGRVTLEPYQQPARRSPTFTVAADAVLVGVSAEAPEPVNRVSVVYERNGIRYFAGASVDVSHPWHWARIGRFADEVESAPQIADGADVQAALDAHARARLAELSDTRCTFSCEMLYDPAVRPGAVGTFAYSDSVTPGAAGIDSVPVLCAAREIDLDAPMLMRVTLEEI